MVVSNTYWVAFLFCFSCTLCCQFLWTVHYSSVFSNVYLFQNWRLLHGQKNPRYSLYRCNIPVRGGTSCSGDGACRPLKNPSGSRVGRSPPEAHGWTCFSTRVGIPIGTNCAPLLADLFLYSYEAYFIQGLLKKNEKKLARSFNFTFRYIDDVLSLDNYRFGDFVDRIYPIELEIKDTTDTDRSASYLDLHLEIDSEGRLRTKLYDKRDDFNFPIVNFPFICSNIPAAPAYGVYISQMIRYSRACGSYQDFLNRGLLLTRKLWTRGSFW